MKDPNKSATSSCGHRLGHCYVSGLGQLASGGSSGMCCCYCKKKTKKKKPGNRDNTIVNAGKEMVFMGNFTII